ncbi:MAG: hypothetical protein QM767_16400 [Anaeromyxobacter sp.]
MTPAHRSLALMAAFAGLFATDLLLGAALRAPLPPLEVVFLKHLALLAALAAWAARSRTPIWRTRRRSLQLARAAALAGLSITFALSLRAGVAAGAAVAALAASPALALVLARALLAERAPAPAWVVAAVGLVAAAAALQAAAPPPAWRALLPLAMAGCFALYLVLTRALRGEPARTNLAFAAAGVVLVLAPGVLGAWVTPGARDLAVLAALALTGGLALWTLERTAALAPVPVPASLAWLPAALGLVALGVAAGQPPPPAALALSPLLLLTGAWACARTSHAVAEPSP